MNLLILYDANATYTNTVREYLESFELYSKNRVFYAPATNNAPCRYDLDHFDAILIHYSVRLCYDWHISPAFAERLKGAPGYKILFIQDEYDCTAQAWRWIRELGVHTVFTCVPEPYVTQAYPPAEVPGVQFVQTLTGWVSPELEMVGSVRPLVERENWLNYRGRNLPVWYGDLAREKMVIGVRMREECERRGIPCDIDWTEESRIYGANWWQFLQGARATLGSESGSNVFDFHGGIRAAIQADLASNPKLTYEELHARHIGQQDGRIRMNQVSPRIFEAAALGTALVLFRGEYSGVVRPAEHYIPLEKDFSNVDSVFESLADVPALQRMADRCRADVILSGEYTYRAFVGEVDRVLQECVGGRDRTVSSLRILEELQRPEDSSLKAITKRAAADVGAALRLRWQVAKNNPHEVIRQISVRVKKGLSRRAQDVGARLGFPERAKAKKVS